MRYVLQDGTFTMYKSISQRQSFQQELEMKKISKLMKKSFQLGIEIGAEHSC